MPKGPRGLKAMGPWQGSRSYRDALGLIFNGHEQMEVLLAPAALWRPSIDD